MKNESWKIFFYFIIFFCKKIIVCIKKQPEFVKFEDLTHRISTSWGSIDKFGTVRTNKRLTSGGSESMSSQMSAASSSDFRGFLDGLRHGPWHVGVTSGQESVDSVGERSGIVSAVEFDGSGSDFRCLVLEWSLSAAGGGVGGFMGTTGGSYFGGFLCWWRECGVREVQVRIVVKSGGKLSRGNTGQSKDKGENLCNIEVIYN